MRRHYRDPVIERIIRERGELPSWFAEYLCRRRGYPGHTDLLKRLLEEVKEKWKRGERG